MNHILTVIIKVTLVVVLGSLISCGDKKPPASKTKVVSQKINAKQVAAKPEAQKSSAKSGAPSIPSSAKTSASPVEPTDAGDKLTGKSSAEAASQASDLIQASMEMATTYDPKGRFDPFEPLFSDEPEANVIPKSVGRKKKRAPQTPLEKVAISQLKLTAIMRTPKGNRGLVEDATGKGYVVKKGTYMGLNAGQVIRIERDRIIIEEEIQNMVGEYIINNAELKLQKPAGEQ